MHNVVGMIQSGSIHATTLNVVMYHVGAQMVWSFIPLLGFWYAFMLLSFKEASGKDC